MREARSKVRLVLVGAGPQEKELRQLVKRGGLEQRVEFRVGIGDDELAGLYGDALAVYYGPFDEDFGYVTLEGFAAARVYLRPRAPQSGRSGFPSVDEWVTAFKEKRRQIVDHHCPA